MDAVEDYLAAMVAAVNGGADDSRRTLPFQSTQAYRAGLHDGDLCRAGDLGPGCLCAVGDFSLSPGDREYADFIEAVRVAVTELRCAQMADTEQYVRERYRAADFPHLIGNIERAGIAAGVLEPLETGRMVRPGGPGADCPPPIVGSGATVQEGERK